MGASARLELAARVRGVDYILPLEMMSSLLLRRYMGIETEEPAM
jgi:hypothetical protein